MATTRREFIKRSAGAVSVGLVMPSLFLTQARGQSPVARRKLVIIQFHGGNDGLNTVIPYTDSRYYALRPTLAFRDTELNAASRSTIISNSFGLHPAMSEIKDLWDQNKVAVTLGVGYQNSTLSHFLAMDIWHTADTGGLAGKGWLGKYADVALFGQQGLPAVAVGGELPKSLYASKVVVPNIFNFQLYSFLTDPAYPGDYANQLNAFNAAASRPLGDDSVLGAINKTAFESVSGAQRVQSAISGYRSSVVYNQNNPLAVALQMLAQLITTVPEASLFYATLYGFDHHAGQIEYSTGRANKFAGQHAVLLKWFSEATKSFYDDLTEHRLADDTLILQWSEFGRRPAENASFGTDHGTTAPLFVIGNAVRGGFYGEQPSLAATQLDAGGNPRFKVDFRSVYATILTKWLNTDARAILGATYENVGFLG